MKDTPTCRGKKPPHQKAKPQAGAESLRKSTPLFRLFKLFGFGRQPSFSNADIVVKTQKNRFCGLA
jgi:hypothetical protein